MLILVNTKGGNAHGHRTSVGLYGRVPFSNFVTRQQVRELNVIIGSMFSAWSMAPNKGRSFQSPAADESNLTSAMANLFLCLPQDCHNARRVRLAKVESYLCECETGLVTARCIMTMSSTCKYKLFSFHFGHSHSNVPFTQHLKTSCLDNTKACNRRAC